MFSISPYKLEMYLRCPRQYKFEYIDALRNMYHKDTPPLMIGGLIHTVLNHYYRRLKKEERTMEKIREVFRDKFLDHQKRKDPKYLVFGGSQETVNKWVIKATKQLENFYRSELSGREPFIAPEENSKYIIGDSEEEKIKLLGKLDRVDKIEGGLHIIDYKTGTLKEDTIDPLQLDFYHLLLTYLAPDEPVIKKTYYYLDEDRLIDVEVRPEETEKVYWKVTETVERIRRDQEFAPFKNHKCRLCDYKSICELNTGSRVEAKEEIVI